MQHGATVFTTGTNKRAEKEVEEIPGRRFMHCHEACMEAQKLDNPMLENDMLPLSEALQLSTRKEIEEQIAVRKELRQKMVGSMWPAIMYDEEQSLRTCLANVEDNTQN